MFHYLRHRPAVVATLFRIAFLIYGAVHDRYSSLKYQDIDYVVISDAAKSMCYQRSSMYAASPEYRYPPVLAWAVAAVDWPQCLAATVLQQSSWFPSEGESARDAFPPIDIFGIRPSKLLFVLADVLVVALIGSILRGMSHRGSAAMDSGGEPVRTRMPTAAATNRWVWFWALNPFAAVIATRGSFDAASNAIVLLALASALERRPGLSGAALGAAVYFRIFPVIYIPALALFFIGGFRPVVFSVKSLATEGRMNKGSDGVQRSDLHSLFRFIACTVLVCVSLGAASYLICGREYLDAAVLYHLTRLDHRHNFSPHFLQVLIGKWVDEAALRRDLMLTSSLPQFALIIISSITLSNRNLIAAFMVNTMILVAFNKVCTAQYFTWFAVFAPLLLGHYDESFLQRRCDPGDGDDDAAAEAVRRKRMRTHLIVGVAAAVGWLGAMGLWLLQAYRLEFLGHHVFLEVWVASLVFQAASVLVIALIVFAANKILPPLRLPGEEGSSKHRAIKLD